MNPSDKDQWAKAHYGHDINVGNVELPRHVDTIRFRPAEPHKGNRALYGYSGDPRKWTVKISPDGKVFVEQNGKKIALILGDDELINAYLIAEAPAMKDLLIDVLNGSIDHSKIHAVLQRATLKR